jgi:hypothetical protein
MLQASVVVIGTAEGDPPITDVVDVAQLGQDTVLVLNAAGPFVHLNATDGGLLALRGGVGDGPGELKRPWDVVVNEDRIWFLDRASAVAWDR